MSEQDNLLKTLKFNNKEHFTKILLDFLKPKTILEKYNIKNTIVFFGSARILPRNIAKEKLNLLLKKDNQEEINKAKNILEISNYYEYATELANKISLWAKKGKNPYYICTGGGPGIMEAANKGAFLANYPSIGFNIKLPFEIEANKYITKKFNFNFNYFFSRKYWLTSLAKAIIIFPGGFGTLDEMFEVFTLVQTNKISHNIPIVLFGTKFFKESYNFNSLTKYGLITEKDKNLFFLTDNVKEAFDYVVNKLQKSILNEKL